MNRTQIRHPKNLAKHGISFEEAKSVFDDPLYIDFYDRDHYADAVNEALRFLVRVTSDNQVD